MHPQYSWSWSAYHEYISPPTGLRVPNRRIVYSETKHKIPLKTVNIW